MNELDAVVVLLTNITEVTRDWVESTDSERHIVAALLASVSEALLAAHAGDLDRFQVLMNRAAALAAIDL